MIIILKCSYPAIYETVEPGTSWYNTIMYWCAIMMWNKGKL